MDCVTHYRCTKKWGHYVKPLCLTAHIFKMSEPICVIFSTLYQHCVLNTPVIVISNLINFVAQSGASWRKLATRTSLSMSAKGMDGDSSEWVVSDKVWQEYEQASQRQTGTIAHNIRTTFLKTANK